MISLELDTRDFDRAMNKLGGQITDWTIPASQLDAAIKADIGREWTNNGRATGGTVRGEKWEKFAEQYTRADGTVIEAWGGVAKVHGRGSVKGRLRPSGKRVTVNSVIGQDTGRFRRALLASKPHIVNKNELIIGGESLPVYAEFVDALRPIVHAIPKDQATMERVTEAYINKVVAEASR